MEGNGKVDSYPVDGEPLTETPTRNSKTWLEKGWKITLELEREPSRELATVPWNLGVPHQEEVALLTSHFCFPMNLVCRWPALYRIRHWTTRRNQGQTRGFSSMRSIGNDGIASQNDAFLSRFLSILEKSALRNEVGMLLFSNLSTFRVLLMSSPHLKFISQFPSLLFNIDIKLKT